jgi:hypothetical protein
MGGFWRSEADWQKLRAISLRLSFKEGDQE